MFSSGTHAVQYYYNCLNDIFNINLFSPLPVILGHKCLDNVIRTSAEFIAGKVWYIILMMP